MVPVGLLGLAMNTIRVFEVIAANIADKSWPKSRAGTLIPFAPTACVAKA